MKVEKIFVGGWFQRTALHLAEIYDFLKEGESPLKLDQSRLQLLKSELGITALKLEVGDFERVVFTANDSITVTIYEDGLITLSRNNSADIASSISELTDYYENRLSKALNYLFSLGAPVPKELADIKIIYPYFLLLEKASRTTIEQLLKKFGQEKYFEIIQKDFEIFRGDELYVINNRSAHMESVERYIEEQIFIREFKAQLHRYLNLHRLIWENIAAVKEQGKIKGRDIAPFREKVESYQKTVNLIGARIEQMDTYIETREAIFKANKSTGKFVGVLQYKYETLRDSLEYVKDLWLMTTSYVNSTLELFRTLQAESTKTSVDNLIIVSSVTAGATLISLFTQEPPIFSSFGVGYVGVLIAIGYGANWLVKTYALNRMYVIHDPEIAKNIK